MSNLSFGAGYWKKQLPLTVLSYLSSFIAIVTDLSLPLLTAAMLDYAVCYDPSKAAGTPDGIFGFLFTGKYGALGTMKLFLSCAAVFLVILLLRLIFIYIKNISFQRAGLRMESDLRDDTYKKLMQLDGSALSGFNTGELMTVMNRDIVMVKEMYTRVFISFFDSVTVMIVTCIFLSSISPWMLLIPVAISPALIFTLIRYARTMKVIFTDVRRAYSDINLTVQENIRGVRLVRAFANETYEEEKFRRDNYRMRDVMFRLDDKMAKYNTFFDGFMQIAYVSAIIICVFLVLNGSLMVGALTAAGAYVMKIMSHITQISQNISNMQRQTVSLGRLKNFLETESGIREYPEALCASARPHIRMENVSLTLGDKQVLKNITLDIPYGKKVGIMGGTGSGKSVLLKSLSRVFDVTSGEISIDGQNVRKYALDALRNEFAYVFQDVFLFSHTIDANIAFYDPEAPEEDVRDAAETAQAARFVEKLEDGYETVVGERGLGLSGGQKQRLSVARALMKRAPVLILDDASSALDMATEKKLLKAVKQKTPENTLLIAAHRVSSVMDCDEIVYLQDGEIVERGTAKELISLGGRFASIYRMQTADGQLDDSSYGKED